MFCAHARLGFAQADANCAIETRATEPIRLTDQRSIYIEPMAFARAAATYALAGEPTYVWTRQNGVFEPQVDTSGSVIGAIFTDTGAVIPLPKPPLQGTVTDIRLTRHGAGYAALFALVSRQGVSSMERTFLGYWFGYTDGTSWSSLEPIRLPPSGEPISRHASALIASGDSMRFAVPFTVAKREDLLVLTRTARGWQWDLTATTGVAYVALTVRAGRHLLYVVRPDPTRRSDANSLSLFVDVDGRWTSRGFVLHGGSRLVHHPWIVERGDERILAWEEQDETAGTRNARAARLLADGGLGTVVTLARSIEDLFPVHGATDDAQWVVSHRPDNAEPSLALIEWNGGRPIVRDVVVNPYTGPALAHAAAGAVVAVGPVMGRTPLEELVVSGTLSLKRRCALPATGGER